MVADRGCHEDIVTLAWMGAHDAKFPFGQPCRLFYNFFRYFQFSDVVQHTREGGGLDVFLAKPQPAGEDVAHQAHVHTVDISIVIHLTHTVKHVEDIDIFIFVGHKGENVGNQIIRIEVFHILDNIVHGIHERCRCLPEVFFKGLEFLRLP